MGVLAVAGSMPAHKKCSTLFYKIGLTSSVHFPFGVRTIPNGSPIFCLSYKLCC